ncbi:MAG: PTS sugar transporter subunit IIA [Verrucomicrobia bacterium GWF2_62_7]|nr:MAG: PTS sugar transporter subunit IIA [Verrucomicrobia bacterium GWF2_62_7]
MYLNLVELAESFGVSEKVVDDWIRDEGLPYVQDRGRLLFDRARVAHWAAGHGLTARAGFLAPENGAFTTGLELAPMLRAGGIWRDVPSSGAIEVLERVIASLSSIPQPVRALLAQRLRAKGGVNWAPIGGGFALPHFSTRVTLGRDAGVITLLLLRDALTLTEPPSDGVPVTRLFFFIPPSPRAHLDTLARLSRAIAHGPLLGLVERSAPDEELFQTLAAADSPGGAELKHECQS